MLMHRYLGGFIDEEMGVQQSLQHRRFFLKIITQQGQGRRM